MKKDHAFLDLDTIRVIGLERFSEIYYWPISDEEFRVFVETVIYDLECLLIHVDRDIFDLVISDYRFLLFIVQHIHYRAAERRFGNLLSQNPAKAVTLNAVLHPDWEGYVEYFSAENLASGHFGNLRKTVKSQIGGRVRYLSYDVQSNVYSNPLECIKYFYQTPQHVSVGPFTEFKKMFLRDFGHYTANREWDYFGIPVVSSDEMFQNRLMKQFLIPYLDILQEQCRSFEIEIDRMVISRAWQQRLIRLNTIYCGYLSLRHFPKELSITAAGNPIRKVLATALQKRGTKTYVLHHGECPGVDVYPNSHINDGSFCDYFVCPTEKITENFRHNYSTSPLEQRVGTQYISSKNSHYDSLRDRYRAAGVTTNLKTIMLIGFPMTYFRYLDCAAAFWYFQLDLQYRVAQLISKSGFKLIYKAHPDRLAEVEGLFSGIADHVESRPFQEVWDTADSYVFTYPGSTVFGHAVLTTKPMLLIESENHVWNMEGYSLLRLRTQIVPAYFDKKNRIIFNQDEFVDKLLNPLPLNDDYINQFLLA